MSLKITLKSGKDQAVYRMHPWIFSGAIKDIKGDATEGCIAEVYNNKNEYLCSGHYQNGTIAVRVLTFASETFDETFWEKRILSAYQLRNRLGLINNSNTNVFRLINAEGDYLPGLIVDYYNGYLVTQFHSIGMYLMKNEIVAALKSVLGDSLKAIYDKSEMSLPNKSNIKAENGFLFGEGDKCEVTENGCKFEVNWVEGQKTGFFIDQRDNRQLLMQYSKGKDVLNTFCYTGGFSVYSLKGEANMVHSVDSSKSAIELTNNNVEINNLNKSSHEAIAVDAFEYLQNIKDKYDVIVLDPPAFAKHQSALNNALQGYKKINQRAFEQIKSGGILFTFSCSQVVTKEDFRKSVFVAAASSGRKVSILHQLTQPADHPVSIYHPEGEYLKGLVCYVE